MYNDYASGIFAGFGLFLVLAIVVYLAILALAMWIGYLIIRTAVKNGILLADRERALPHGGSPGVPPAYAAPLHTA